jgi:hypothetical protein
MRRVWTKVLWAMVAMVVPATAAAQVVAATDDPDRDLQVVVGEPDFTLGALPTTLRLPKGKMAFRITHRFTYAINDGSVGQFFENGFGFDSSATTGFELRFGLASGTQLTVHRTGSRNIQFLAQRQMVAQRDGRGLSFDVVGAIEGQNNFREEYSFVAGGVLSHRMGDRGAIYLEPIYVVNATPEFPASDENTLVLGIGTRIRLFNSRAYLVAEVAPRVSGYGGTSLMTFGIEKRAGGHMFQLNVSNAFGTTLTQVGHGGPATTHWHLGFNLTRKFY